MDSNKHIVRCNDCGIVLDEAIDIPAEQRTPCPECGSIKREFKIALEGAVYVHSLLGIKAQSAKSRKPFLEQRVGDSLQYSTGRWMKIQRVIDRLKNWYSEIVSDPETGKVIHHTEEPLTSHQGHGDAKKKNKKVSDG
jgi:hypothetical protein